MSADDPFHASSIAARAQKRLDLAWPRTESGHSGDFDLNHDWTAAQDRETLRQAAVLIPVIDTGTEARVVLTHRTDHLPSHAGQVAFPGGKMERTDASPAHAALREAHEEIGLDPVETDAQSVDS